jgi:hypothetical protein
MFPKSGIPLKADISLSIAYLYGVLGIVTALKIDGEDR